MPEILQTCNKVFWAQKSSFLDNFWSNKSSHITGLWAKKFLIWKDFWPQKLSKNDYFWPQKSSLWLCKHSGPRNLHSEMISGPRNCPKMMISGPRKLHYDQENLYRSILRNLKDQSAPQNPVAKGKTKPKGKTPSWCLTCSRRPRRPMQGQQKVLNKLCALRDQTPSGSEVLPDTTFTSDWWKSFGSWATDNIQPQ